MEKKDATVVDVHEVPSQSLQSLTYSQRSSQDSERGSEAYPVHLLLDQKLQLEVRDVNSTLGLQ